MTGPQQDRAGIGGKPRGAITERLAGLARDAPGVGHEGDEAGPATGSAAAWGMRDIGSAVLASVNVRASSRDGRTRPNLRESRHLGGAADRSNPGRAVSQARHPPGPSETGQIGRRPRYAPADDIPRQRGPPVTLPAPAPAATEDLATPVRYAAWAVYARTGIVEHAADAMAALDRWAKPWWKMTSCCAACTTCPACARTPTS